MGLTIHADPVPLAPDAAGTIRVANTRVTLDTVIEHYRAGATAEALLERFPVLSAADVHAVLAYYLRHRDEVDSYLAEQARQAEAALARLGDHHQPWAAVRASMAGLRRRERGREYSPCRGLLVSPVRSLFALSRGLCPSRTRQSRV
jgi:uncharacterized protein (DUF433 family)